MRLSGVAFALALLVGPTLADGVLPKIITPADTERLAQFDSVKATTLAEARAKGAPADVKILDAALAGVPLKTEDGFDASGTWHCRKLKLGGGLPLVVYPPFKCVVSDDSSGWFLRKVTGSQRTQGRFYTESATRMIYLGAAHIWDEPPGNYGDNAEQDQVAVAERLGENRLVLQFPKPLLESDFDLLVMER